MIHITDNNNKPCRNTNTTSTSQYYHNLLNLEFWILNTTPPTHPNNKMLPVWGVESWALNTESNTTTPPQQQNVASMRCWILSSEYWIQTTTSPQQQNVPCISCGILSSEYLIQHHHPNPTTKCYQHEVLNLELWILNQTPPPHPNNKMLPAWAVESWALNTRSNTTTPTTKCYQY